MDIFASGDEQAVLAKLPDLDLNEVYRGSYAIHLAIMRGMSGVVDALLARGVRLDMLDGDGRSVLYLPIKLGQQLVLRKLATADRQQAGVSVLNIRDAQGQTPLHYALQHGADDVVSELLGLGADPAHADLEGNTPLHAAVLANAIIPALLDKAPLDARNKQGETALHMAVSANAKDMVAELLRRGADVNASTYVTRFTPLCYAVVGGNQALVDVLLRSGASPQVQDVKGDSPLHFAAQGRMHAIFAMLLPKTDVRPLINATGDTVAHAVLKNALHDQVDFPHLLKHCKVNAQDADGRTVWHLLVAENVWETYANVLRTTKNKVFIQDRDGAAAFDQVPEDRRGKLTALLADSYRHTLQHARRPLVDAEDRRCKQAFDKTCDAHILRQVQSKRAVPEVDRKQLITYPQPAGTDGRFIGTSLDLVCGLLHLARLPGVAVGLTGSFAKNAALQRVVAQQGRTLSSADFSNFELNWFFHQLVMPTDLSYVVSGFLAGDKQFLCMLLNIELSNGSHSNAILVSKSARTMERFEPYGSLSPPDFYYNATRLDAELESALLALFPGYKYLAPPVFQPQVGPQVVDSLDKRRSLLDPKGYCAVWSLWYQEMRASNPSVPPGVLCRKLVGGLRLQHKSLRVYIRQYSAGVVQYRDELLAAVGLTIDDWHHNNFTPRQHGQLVELLRQAASAGTAGK